MRKSNTSDRSPQCVVLTSLFKEFTHRCWELVPSGKIYTAQESQKMLYKGSSYFTNISGRISFSHLPEKICAFRLMTFTQYYNTYWFQFLGQQAISNICTLYSSGSSLNGVWPGWKKAWFQSVVLWVENVFNLRLNHLVHGIPPSSNLPFIWGSSFAFKTCRYAGDIQKYRHCFSLIVLFNPCAFHESIWNQGP